MTWRRWLGAAVVAVALAVPAVWFGVTTAQTEYAFGPHQATYQVTLNGRLTVDMGPVGSLVAPTRLSWPLDFAGLKVVVGAIPEALEVPIDAQSLADSASEYAVFFGAMDVVAAAVGHGLVVDALIRAGLVWGGLLLAAAALAVLLGRRRLGELASFWRRRRLTTVAIVAGLLVGGFGLEGWRVRSMVRAEGTLVASPVFEGTVLEGARVTGRLGQALDDYGAQALQAYHQTTEFYEQAAQSARSALEVQVAMAQFHGPPEPLAATGRWGGGPYGGLRPVVVASDLHCNVGMAQVVGAVAQGTGARVVLDAGDITMDGTSVEAYCVDGAAQAYGPDVTVVAVGGNHDTALSAEQESAAGMTVLAGEVVEVEGLRLLGDADWAHTSLAQGTIGGSETATQLGRRLGGLACDDPVDLLLVHDPQVARIALERGCAPLAISGHMHARSGPEVVGRGLAFTASSTGRDVAERTVVGPLGAPAEVPVLLLNSMGRLVAIQIVTVQPDATVSLSPIQVVPVVPSLAPEPPDAGAVVGDGPSSPVAPQSFLVPISTNWSDPANGM